MSEENKKDEEKKKKNPLEEAMEILESYDEGTPKKQSGFDHWGE